MGLGQNMYVMLCGRFTPRQRHIIQKRFKLNSELFFDILSYFIELTGHPVYVDMAVPDEFPAPILMADAPDDNNTEKEINKEVEGTFVGGNYDLVRPRTKGGMEGLGSGALGAHIVLCFLFLKLATLVVNKGCFAIIPLPWQ